MPTVAVDKADLFERLGREYSKRALNLTSAIALITTF